MNLRILLSTTLTSIAQATLRAQKAIPAFHLKIDKRKTTGPTDHLSSEPFIFPMKKLDFVLSNNTFTTQKCIDSRLKTVYSKQNKSLFGHKMFITRVNDCLKAQHKDEKENKIISPWNGLLKKYD